jgi:hypothetical protein
MLTGHHFRHIPLIAGAKRKLSFGHGASFPGKGGFPPAFPGPGGKPHAEVSGRLGLQFLADLRVENPLKELISGDLVEFPVEV